MTEVVSRANQEAFRPSTTLWGVPCVLLESIPLSRDHHHAQLGVVPASTRRPRENLLSSPTLVRPVLATSTALPAVLLRATAPVPPASSAPPGVRVCPVLRERSSLLLVPPPPVRLAPSTVSGPRPAVSRSMTVWSSPRRSSRRCVPRGLSIISTNPGFDAVRHRGPGKPYSRATRSVG